MRAVDLRGEVLSGLEGAEACEEKGSGPGLGQFQARLVYLPPREGEDGAPKPRNPRHLARNSVSDLRIWCNDTSRHCIG